MTPRTSPSSYFLSEDPKSIELGLRVDYVWHDREPRLGNKDTEDEVGGGMVNEKEGDD